MLPIFYLLLFLPFCLTSYFRLILIFVQDVRWGGTFYNFNNQINLWNLHDLIQASIQEKRSYQIMQSLLETRLLMYEIQAANDNSLHNFLNHFFTKYPKSLVDELNIVFLISHELQSVLPSSIIEQLKRRLVNNFELPIQGIKILQQLQPPLLRFYVLSSFSHFKSFFVNQNSLHAKPGCSNILEMLNIEGQMKEVDFLKARIKLLRSNIPQIFKEWNSNTVHIIAVSWSLMQYLKYISRFYPEFRPEIYQLLNLYFDCLSNFFQAPAK